MHCSCPPRPLRGTNTWAGSRSSTPGESERFSFEELKKTTLERLPAVPKFTWKLKEVPLHLDRAVWVEDKDFDIDRHLRRIAVPSPGGRREVGELVGMLMSYQLDRRRPLWEMWYVEGVAGGQVAMIMKYHHCLMDGMSGAGLAEQLLDLEPDPAPREIVGPEEAPVPTSRPTSSSSPARWSPPSRPPASWRSTPSAPPNEG